MATHTRTITTDDLTGEEGAQRHVISLDGRHYEIDLTDTTWNDFLAVPAIDEITRVGRIVKAIDTAAPKPHRDKTKTLGLDLGAVREWAAANGHTLGSRGRIPAAVLNAYRATQAAS